MIDPHERRVIAHEEVLRADPRPDGNWSVTRMTYDTTRTNGILMSPDERTLYVAQSHSEPGRIRELRAYPVRDNALWANTRYCTSSARTAGDPRGV